jgi:DNA adenine methylase
MPTTYTPLRYPGGKSKLGPFLAQVFTANKLIDGLYAEPYAGGAGAGLFLVFRGYATRFLLNDIDRGVVSFWRAVLNHNERFASLIEKVPLTVAEWDRQKDAYATERQGFNLGFAFFYLNRTNRSGIMNAGIIGGRKQASEWGIDARFTREDLARRVRALAAFRRNISVSRLDALDFLQGIASERRSRRTLVYLDPPYFRKGQDLYTNFYTPADHAAIADRLAGFRLPWLLTYDDCPEIRKLYRRLRVYESEVTYSAREKTRGREIVVLAPYLKLPSEPPRSKRDYAPGFELLV